MVKQLTQLIMQSSPSGKAAPIDKDHEIAACRADARRVDTLYHHRNAFLEQLNDVDTSNAQKHFEQLRAAKEAFRQRFQAFDDDVVSFVHEHDVKILVDECSRALRPPKVVAKKAMPVFVYQDSHLGGMEKTTEAATPPAPCAGQWIEPLALLQAKGRIEDADVEFTESVKCLRLVDDDLKRTDNVFITPSEIELQLDTWLGRLRATRRARTDIAPRLIEHARGGKAVLFRRMQAHREMRTASDVSEIDQVVPAVQGRLGARKATDAAAIDRLQPAVAAELAGFVKAELAWTHARFTDTTLKDKPIPRDMLPFSTFVWCPCDRPSVQNALLALVFALRTSRQRGQPEVALCPPVNVHDRPLWLQHEQLVSLPQDMEGVDDIVAAQQTLLADAWRLCGQVLFVTGSFLTSTTALDDAGGSTRRGFMHVWHIQLDARAASIVRQTSLPAPVNTTMLDVDATFVCDDCRSLRPETLVASPCHQCTFRRPQDNPAFAALVSEVASMLQQPVPHGLQSPPPSTQLAPALYQLRKSHAERQWLHNKAAYVRGGELEQVPARAAGVVEFERHVFDRYAQDVDDLVTIQASLQQLKQAKQRHSRSTVVGFDVQCAGLGVALATTTSRIAWLRDQMLCLEEDAVGRMQRATDLAAGTLLPYRALIKSLQELCGQYTAVNDQCYAALQDSIVYEAEIAFAQDAIVTSCISSWELQVASMLETITAVAPAEDAHKLFSAAMAPVFTFVPSVAPCNFDGEWLQRAVTDLQVHEKHVLDRIEDGFVHAKHLDSARFEATYGVRSDVAAEAIPLDVPCAILRDVAWTRPDQAMDVEEAWASIHAMAARVQDETMDRRKKYLHSRCCILFLQTVVEMAHQAWVRQCHHVLDVNSTGLAAAERHLHEMSGPRLDSERAFRAAKDDLSLCRHKLRCFDEEQARNSQVQVALRESMLHLREILATQSHVESVARQANLKQTKRLWDELLAFQSTCFASAFEDASQLEAQMDRMVVERALLSSHVDRAEDLVTAKEAAWKSALWAHLCATIRVQKWQTSLYSLLHVVVELETKRQRALDLDLYVHADAVKGDATQFVDSALIESSMLRLELQKQSRLTQYSFNRVRTHEMVQICLDEAARKTRLNNALVDRCRFLDRTLAQLRAMAAGSTAHTADKVYRALDQVMHTALDASWRRCHIQTAAFAEENWLVQHRKNVVLALESMLATAVESHNENKATLAILQRAQADQVAACALAPSPDVKPLDATHLMLILNARASATWSRQANLKRTVLHEAMHLKRADKLEWFKVDPHHNRCAQASAVDKVATFATLNPDPALFDVRAMQTWGRFPSLCADARGALELQLRRVALSWDLRAPNVDCHEAIWGGDLKSKDVVHIYGRPHRFTTDAFAARVRAVVAAISTAKYIRRFLAHVRSPSVGRTILWCQLWCASMA
ncbi:hypothetical protein DYB32_004589 [Aphanomyces invadans]|uniref:Uncharacterized protein n=1 Tax=Aphanomyces invadans TaxID=157072 RepID=A0A3R6ZQU4_9STRA|nr:hypothetical protein DYB32_004589 [Aphanomyces invadans]